MSPAKGKKKPKGNTLTIEFSGITTLIWDQAAGTAEVRMVDLASAGFHRHYAALGMAVDERTPHRVTGPDAEAAISLPRANMDMGIWNLVGTDVEILGGSGELSADRSKIDATKKPTSKATSIRWIPDIGFLTGSKALNPACPISAVIRLPAGRITASTSAGSRQMEFQLGAEQVAPARYYLARFKAEIPFDTEIALRLDRRRVLVFEESMSVLMSNTCVCGLGTPATQNYHFKGHYEVTQAARRPEAQRPGKGQKLPAWPEFCWPGVVEP